MPASPVMNFMKQQGFAPEAPDRAALRFRGLQFQPTIVGSAMLVAILLLRGNVAFANGTCPWSD